MGFFQFGRRRSRKRSPSPSKIQHDDYSTLSSVPVSEVRVPVSMIRVRTYHHERGWTETTPWMDDSTVELIPEKPTPMKRLVSFIHPDPIVVAREAHEEKSIDPMDDNSMVQRIMEGLKDSDEKLLEEVQSRWVKAKKNNRQHPVAIVKGGESHLEDGTEGAATIEAGREKKPRTDLEEAVAELAMRMVQLGDRLEAIAQTLGIMSAPTVQDANNLQNPQNLGTLGTLSDLGGAPDTVASIIDLLELDDLRQEMGVAVCTAMENLTSPGEVKAKEVQSKEALPGKVRNKSEVMDVVD